MNAIQNCETEGASDQETMPECCHYGRRSRGVSRSKILGQIGGSHDQPRDPRTCRCNALGTQHAARRFNHAPDGQALWGSRLNQNGLRLSDGIGAFDFRQQDGIDWHRSRRNQIRMTPLGCQCIDSQHEFSPAVVARRQRPGNAVAR